MSNFKSTLLKYLNKALYLYNLIIILLIKTEDNQRRRAQHRRENIDPQGFALHMQQINEKLSNLFTRKHFTYKEQLQVIDSLSMAVKFSNSVTQPFEFISERRDLRSFVRKTSATVREELNYASLYQCLEGKGVLDAEYVTQLKIADRTGDFIPTYTAISDSIKEKQKRKQAFLKIMVQPLMVLVAAIGIEIFIAFSIVPDQIMYIQDGNIPPTMKSYSILNEILSYHKLEYGLKFAIFAVGIYLFFKIPATKLLLQLFIMQIPGLSSYISKWEISKFFESLNSLINSGASLKEAMDVSLGMISNKVIRRSISLDVDRFGTKTSDLSIILKDSVYIDISIRNQLKQASDSGGDNKSVLQTVVDEYKEYMKVLLDAPMQAVMPIMLALGGTYVFARLIPLFNEMQQFTGM